MIIHTMAIQSLPMALSTPITVVIGVLVVTFFAVCISFVQSMPWSTNRIAQIAVFCVHRVYIHPLARYPGPFLAKITNLYSAYHAWRGDIHIDMWRCHQKYG